MKHNGFTLIETMIVIAIIGICAAIFIPAWQKYERQTREETPVTTPLAPTTAVPATPPPSELSKP